MKKAFLILVFVALASMVVSVGVGYAADGHQPATGTKLLGYGPVGTTFETTAEGSQYSSSFTFSNPDCTNSISIDRLCIVQANGTVIYEGAFLQGGPSGTEVVSLAPHGVVMVNLTDWMSPTSPFRFYTVEVGWRSTRKALPLIGHSIIWQKDFFADGTYTLGKTRVAMERYP